ncbi:MAG: hypothetical protein D6753_13980 [Planctomycetota bacterium]|nr:MAG: hypothetical protein D6753_13980 [Planctomycetota bacterium]
MPEPVYGDGHSGTVRFVRQHGKESITLETSIHRQLKERYAVSAGATEVVMDGFRIDAIGREGELIEIQHASLAAMRRKTEQLLATESHRLRIVKPILAKKRVTTVQGKQRQVVRSRMSPLRGEVLDIFLELVHFCTVFPRPRLVLDVVLVEAEELREDRRRPTRRGKKYRTVDQRLVDVVDHVELTTHQDLIDLLPIHALPAPFDTAELAAALQRPRWFAQKVAYCLRTCGAAELAGKRRNSLLYAIPGLSAPAKRPARRRKKKPGTKAA